MSYINLSLSLFPTLSLTVSLYMVEKEEVFPETETRREETLNTMVGKKYCLL